MCFISNVPNMIAIECQDEISSIIVTLDKYKELTNTFSMCKYIYLYVREMNDKHIAFCDICTNKMVNILVTNNTVHKLTKSKCCECRKHQTRLSDPSRDVMFISDVYKEYSYVTRHPVLWRICKHSADAKHWDLQMCLMQQEMTYYLNKIIVDQSFTPVKVYTHVFIHIFVSYMIVIIIICSFSIAPFLNLFKAQDMSIHLSTIPINPTFYHEYKNYIT